jgi:hypothetical protein
LAIARRSPQRHGRRRDATIMAIHYVPFAAAAAPAGRDGAVSCVRFQTRSITIASTKMATIATKESTTRRRSGRARSLTSPRYSAGVTMRSDAIALSPCTPLTWVIVRPSRRVRTVERDRARSQIRACLTLTTLKSYPHRSKVVMVIGRGNAHVHAAGDSERHR